MKKLGILGSGEVVYDRPQSHLHHEVEGLLGEALPSIDSQGQAFFVHECDMGRTVGETICVATQVDDEIVYAQRPGRHGLSRFVTNRTPEPCSAVTVVLKRDRFEDYYVLITAFVGHKAEPEPWDRNATPRSRQFWTTHALVWGSEDVIPGTKTTRCPW